MTAVLTDNCKMTKTCKRCKLDLDLSLFGTNNACPGGKHPICKDCDAHRLSCGPDHKVCGRCLEVKPRSEYAIVGKSKRIARYCDPCAILAKEELAAKKVEQDRAYYAREHDWIREQAVWQRLMVRYGVTKEWWEETYEKQGGVCAICKKAQIGTATGNRLHVDHCHTTGQVRGLLCAGCNTHLGILEKKDWRALAEAYLEEYA